MGGPRPADRRDLQGGVGAPGTRRGRRSDRRAGSPRRLRRLGRRRNQGGTHRLTGHLVRTAHTGVTHCCCQPRAVTKPRVDPRPELPSLGTVSVARAVGQWMGHPARRGGRALDVWKADRPGARRRTQLDAVDLDVLALTGAPEQVVERAAGVAEAVGPEGDDDRRLELHATSIARRGRATRRGRTRRRAPAWGARRLLVPISSVPQRRGGGGGGGPPPGGGGGGGGSPWGGGGGGGPPPGGGGGVGRDFV